MTTAQHAADTPGRSTHPAPEPPAQRTAVQAPPSAARLVGAGVTLVLAAAALLFAAAAPAAAQSTTAEFAGMLLTAPDGPTEAERCATPVIFARQLRSGFAPPGSPRALAAVDPTETRDRLPLWYDQSPRLLRANHRGGLTLNNFLVIGDVPTLEFERWAQSAPDDDDNLLTETWRRVRTGSMHGRVASVFRPSWTDEELWDSIGPRRRGFDQPKVYFGKLSIPGNDDDVFHIWLTMAPMNVPRSEVRRIDATTQYASHVANLVIRNFGDGRRSDDYDLDLQGAAKAYYRHFRDNSASIAFVSRHHQLAGYGAFHRNVRNTIRGIGMDQFDNSYWYGSTGALRSVEFYTGALFGTNDTSTHEIGHQWVDYWDWSDITGVEGGGHDPENHTPLLFPGEAYAGAVLEVTRRVKSAGGSAYTIERTADPARLHPTTLYRMGLLRTSDVPDLMVFDEQGQFDEKTSAEPDAGTKIQGGARRVSINDILAEHGSRTGPVDSSWSRATVVVSRDGLLSADEMSFWNFYAARHAAREDVTSWDGVPSFYEASDGVRLRTDVSPRRARKIVRGPEPAPRDVHRDEIRGFRLDRPVPTVIDTGDRVTISGRVTATDRDDFNWVCIRWRRDGVANDDQIYECERMSGGRFSVPYTFSPHEAGRYALEMFLFWPDSGRQYSRSSFSTITVRAR